VNSKYFTVKYLHQIDGSLCRLHQQIHGNYHSKIKLLEIIKIILYHLSLIFDESGFKAAFDYDVRPKNY
jgi:hypothetical protein